MHVSLAQLCSARDVDANLESCRELAERALQRGADWILFPENAPFLGKDREKVAVAESLDGPMVDHFRTIARDGGVWVTLGSFPEEIPGEERTFNTQVLIDPEGATAAVYRKLHLFDVDVEGGRQYRESESVSGGDTVVDTSIDAGADRRAGLGLTICYDLRFPSLYRTLVERGADILTVPSAFTLQTGRDHWDPLLRARAIESQAWVLAPNQWGNHFGDRSSYGHSSVYDPWGQRVACASDGVGLVDAHIDLERVDQVRRRMPCLEHVRIPTAGQPQHPEQG